MEINSGFKGLMLPIISPQSPVCQLESVTCINDKFFFFFQALKFLVESFGLLNDLFPLPSILEAGYPVFDLHLALLSEDHHIPLHLLSSASI